jgi:all-trans-retinol 13,14-reductase
VERAADHALPRLQSYRRFIKDQFDAIVIGSGVGGLVAGALYARSGRSVLVLERNPSVGGAASVYRIGDLTIEASLHELDGLDDGDTKSSVFRHLGLFDTIEFVEVGDLFEVRSPVLGDPFVMPAGLENGRVASSARFPQHASALDDYFRRLVAVREAVRYVAAARAKPRWRQLLGAPLFPLRTAAVLRERKRSVGGALHELFGDDEAVKLALCAHLAYYGADAATMWFPFFALAQASYHVGGGHYPRGGSKMFATRLADLITEAGGEIRTGRRATRILCEDGRVAGVAHVDAAKDDGQPDSAATSLVFGNAAPNALAEMLPEKERRALVAAYSDRSPSTSLWTIALGFDRPPRELGVSSWSTVVFPDWLRGLAELRDCAALLADAPAGRLPYFIFVDYSHVDTGLTPSAPYLGTISGLDRIENWRGLGGAAYNDRQARWIDALVAALDKEFPGLAGAVVQSDMTTARSIESYLGTPGGAVYGFAPEPGKAGFARPQTPVTGLLLASAYTGFGGYSGSIMGGAAAAGRAIRASRRKR